MRIISVDAIRVLGSRQPERPEEGDTLTAALRGAARATADLLTIHLELGGLERVTYAFLDPLITEIGLVAQDTGDYRDRYLLVSGLEEVVQSKLIALLTLNHRTIIWLGRSTDPYPDNPGLLSMATKVEVGNRRFALIGDLEPLRSAVRPWIWTMKKQGPFHAEEAREGIQDITLRQVRSWFGLLRQRKLLSRTLPEGPGGGSVYERLHPDDMTPLNVGG